MTLSRKKRDASKGACAEACRCGLCETEGMAKHECHPKQQQNPTDNNNNNNNTNTNN